MAPSAVACSRLSGVRRSWAALSSTVRMPSVSCSILSSMVLISRASVLISSSASRTGSRCDRSPRMICVATAEIAPACARMRRPIQKPPPSPSSSVSTHRRDQAAHHQILDVLPLLHVVAHQHVVAAGQLETAARASRARASRRRTAPTP